jgi:DNA-binding IclR family transcriptional regulator
MISQDQETELYHLGAECFVLGTLASERYGIHRAALPFLARITNSTEDTALLTVRRDWRAICLHREEGTFPIRSHSVGAGDHNPLGVSAGGLAILATLSDAEVEESLKANATEIAKGYPKVTLNLIRKDVAITRDKGYSFNPGRVFPGSWGVGVAVLNARRESEGALSIAAIENRLGERRRQEVAAFLKNEAAHLAEILARPKGASSLRASTGRPVAANSSR